MHKDDVLGVIQAMETFATSSHRWHARLARYESDHFLGTLSPDAKAAFERDAQSALIALRYCLERLEYHLTNANDSQQKCISKRAKEETVK